MSVDYGMLNVEMLKCGAGCVKTGAIGGGGIHTYGGIRGADGANVTGGSLWQALDWVNIGALLMFQTIKLLAGTADVGKVGLL